MEKNKSVRKNFIQEHFPALILVVCAFFIWLAILLRKHFVFGYDDWDLAFFTQAMWQLSHGKQFISLFDMNFFGNHANFFSFLILPVFALFPHSFTLVAVKLLFFCFGAFIFYLLAKDTLSKPLALLMLFLYFIYPANIFAVAYEFDFETLAVPFLFLLVYFFRKDNWRRFMITSAVMITIKENMPLVIMAFGIYGLFSKGKNKVKWGLIVILLGGAAFYFLTVKIIPFFSQQSTHGYVAIYKGLGATVPQILLSIIFNPLKVISLLVTPANLIFLLKLFSPLMFVPLFSPHILFLASPILLQHLLSNVGPAKTIYFQYVSTIAPFIFLAFVSALAYLKTRIRPRTFHALIFIVVYLTVLSVSLEKKYILRRTGAQIDNSHFSRRAVVERIPKKAAIVSTFAFLAELATRPELYSFHKIYFEGFQNSPAPYVLPEHVQYALIDFEETWITERSDSAPHKMAGTLRQFLNRGWSVIYAIDNVVLFQRQNESVQKLVKFGIPPQVSADEKYLMAVGEEFQLKGLEKIRILDGNDSILHLKFFWKVLKDVEQDYDTEIQIYSGGRLLRRAAHQIGYGIFPTIQWRSRAEITEQFWLYLPPADHRGYDVYLSVIERKTKQKIKLLLFDQNQRKDELLIDQRRNEVK
jgi:uncharacterized membrane protein